MRKHIVRLTPLVLVADNIWGGLGKDILFGYAGDDTIYGEEGDDELQGGGGGNMRISANDDMAKMAA